MRTYASVYRFIVRSVAAATLFSLPVGASAPASVGLAGRGLLQVALTVSDLPRAIIFYRDTLGWPLDAKILTGLPDREHGSRLEVSGTSS